MDRHRRVNAMAIVGFLLDDGLDHVMNVMMLLHFNLFTKIDHITLGRSMSNGVLELGSKRLKGGRILSRSELVLLDHFL